MPSYTRAGTPSVFLFPRKFGPIKKMRSPQMGPSSPRQVPPRVSDEKTKQKHKVMFKMTKREQRSHSGPSRVRWTAAPLARRKPLRLRESENVGKAISEQMQSLERGQQASHCQQAAHLLPWADADPAPGLTCGRQGCPEGRAMGKDCELWEVALHQRA